MPAVTPMPQYQCHKKVWALKIAGIEWDADRQNQMIIPADKGYAPFSVSEEYIRKHQPQVGGYFVQYEDGYKSYSPAEAFESGYTLITGKEPTPCQ